MSQRPAVRTAEGNSTHGKPLFDGCCFYENTGLVLGPNGKLLELRAYCLCRLTVDCDGEFATVQFFGRTGSDDAFEGERIVSDAKAFKLALHGIGSECFKTTLMPFVQESDGGHGGFSRICGIVLERFKRRSRKCA